MSKQSSNYVCQSIKIVSIMLLCLTSSSAKPLTRLERQTLTRELGTGLTSTGTSFNSFYGDQGNNWNDLNNGYPEQQLIDYGKWDRGYGNHYGNYGNQHYNNYGRNYHRYQPSAWAGDFGGYGGTSNWRGFGYNRNSPAFQNTKSQFGIKY